MADLNTSVVYDPDTGEQRAPVTGNLRSIADTRDEFGLQAAERERTQAAEFGMDPAGRPLQQAPQGPPQGPPQAEAFGRYNVGPPGTEYARSATRAAERAEFPSPAPEPMWKKALNWAASMSSSPALRAWGMANIDRARQMEGLDAVGHATRASAELWNMGDYTGSMKSYGQVLQDPALRKNPTLYASYLKHYEDMNQSLSRRQAMSDVMGAIQPGTQPMDVARTILSDPRLAKEDLSALMPFLGKGQLSPLPGIPGAMVHYDPMTGQIGVVRPLGNRIPTVEADLSPEIKSYALSRYKQSAISLASQAEADQAQGKADSPAIRAWADVATNGTTGMLTPKMLEDLTEASAWAQRPDLAPPSTKLFRDVNPDAWGNLTKYKLATAGAGQEQAARIREESQTRFQKWMFENRPIDTANTPILDAKTGIPLSPQPTTAAEKQQIISSRQGVEKDRATANTIIQMQSVGLPTVDRMAKLVPIVMAESAKNHWGGNIVDLFRFTGERYLNSGDPKERQQAGLFLESARSMAAIMATMEQTGQGIARLAMFNYKLIPGAGQGQDFAWGELSGIKSQIEQRLRGHLPERGKVSDVSPQDYINQWSGGTGAPGTRPSGLHPGVALP